MPTIDDLQIEINHSSDKAVRGIDGLIDSLSRLKTVTRGGVGLTTVTNQLRKLNDAVSGIKDPTENIRKLVSALKPLESIQKTNLNSTLNSLKKLPEITQQLSSIDMDGFASQIERVVTSIRPLAEEMNKVAAGFSAFPSRIQRLITQNERLSTANKKTGRSFGVMGTGISQLKVKLGVLYFALRRVAREMTDWVKESNDYVENLNLFRITMRGASDDALDFANKVYDTFGVDPSEWIRFQAVFQNMATGFGIAADKATVMSKNLTQLGYDLATIFNVDYEVAMQKLQSALAGQPRPMREWGFDMSEATLKLAALRHGIEANVETMTQYEKSQIRYLQLMETAKRQGILGNFAREIHTPANAMRILNQQLKLFKRELGNMIIPLLMKILPYLQAFVRVLTDAAKALAAVFGFELPVIDYSGLGELPPLLDDTEDGFEDASNAAKKFKNLLMGFDEINILPKDTVGAGLGAGGIGEIGGGLDIDPSIYDYDFLGDVSNKVNEIVDEIYRKVEPFVNFVRDNFDHIKDVVVAVGIGLLSWQIAKGVLNFFQWLKEFGQGGEIAIGMTLMFTGIALGTTGIGNLVAGSGDVIDVIKAAIGGALGLGGALIAFGTGPVGWTIGVAATLVIAIGGIALGMDSRYKQSEIGKYVASLEDIQKEAQGAVDKVDKLMRNIRDSRKTFDSEWGVIDALARKYHDLATKADLTNDKKNLLVEYGRMLVSEVPELIDLIDLETGAYKGTNDELFKLIDQTKEYYRLQAVREDLIELYNAQYQVEKQLSIIGDKRTEIERKIKEQEAKRNKILQEKNLFLGQGIVEYLETGRAIKDLEKRYEELTATGKELEGQQKDIIKEIGYSTKVLGGWADTTDTALDEVAKKVQGFELPKLELEIDVKKPNVSGGWADFLKIQGYASGGFPTEGELFIAREAGPELVGSMGGRTAVANNDQIVSAVSAGVAKAVSSVIGRSSGESGDIVIQVNEMELGRISKSAINKYNKVAGNMALEL